MKKGIWILVITFACVHCSGQDHAKSSTEGKVKTIEAVYKVAETADNIRSFIISQSDTIRAEVYYGQYAKDSLDHVRSVTKSVMSLLIGIAIDKGYIKSVDDPIVKYLGSEAEGKEKVTIKHLLTMTSGIKWDEGRNASGYNAWVTSGDHIAYILNRPIVNKPGTVWNYNSPGTHLLSVILSRASDMSTLDFAKQYLFGPLGIKAVRWERLSGGYYNGGAGLQLKPTDMMRLGQLIAHRGTHEEKRVISAAYVDEATLFHQPEGANFSKEEGYGYCWWIVEVEGDKGIAALGYGGQIIAVFPKWDAVVCITHHWRVNGKKAGQQQVFAQKQLVLPIFEMIRKGHRL